MVQALKRYVGGGVLRKEDQRLLTGQGRYVDDLAVAGMVWMAVVRSPYAHARITSIDTLRSELNRLKQGEPLVLQVEREGSLSFLVLETN